MATEYSKSCLATIVRNRKYRPSEGGSDESEEEIIKFILIYITLKGVSFTVKRAFQKPLNKLKKDAESLGVSLNIREVSDNENMVIVANTQTKKIGLLIIDQLSTSSTSVRAFTINVKKWDWFKKDRFTEKDLIGKLTDQVFKEVSLKSLLKKLI